MASKYAIVNTDKTGRQEAKTRRTASLGGYMVVSNCGVVIFRDLGSRLMAAVKVDGVMSVVVPDAENVRQPRSGVKTKVSTRRKIPSFKIDGVKYPSYTVYVHEELEKVA